MNDSSQQQQQQQRREQSNISDFCTSQQQFKYCSNFVKCSGLRSFTDEQVIECLLEKVELGYLVSRIGKQIAIETTASQSSHHLILYHSFDLTQLSPGEIQRLHIARILLWRPVWAFIDEGFSGIDVNGRRKLLEAITRSGISLVMVSHASTGDQTHHHHPEYFGGDEEVEWRQLTLGEGAHALITKL
jgi:ABC-type uncharacterized transport system fused permease/ATPase subunit